MEKDSHGVKYRRRFYDKQVEKDYRDYADNAGLTATQSRIARMAFQEGMYAQQKLLQRLHGKK